MFKCCSIFLFTLLAASTFATVNLTAPGNGLTVSSPVSFVATGSTTCSKGVASMGIYTAPWQLAYVVNGASLNTALTLSPGTYNTTVTEWDNCGGSSSTPATITVSNGAGVYVSAPGNNTTVSSPVNFIASATSNCSKGVASMGIYTAPWQLAYVVNGASLNTKLTLSPGTYNTTVTEWDNCGGSLSTKVTITVSGGTGSTFSSLQNSGGWTGYGELPPNYAICDSCKPGGPQVTWSMWQGIKSPSLSGKAAQFNIGGTTDYADVLWNNHLIGDLSSQGLPDTNHTLVPTLHNFTYDVYFWGSNVELAQALEFDINQFFDGLGFIWGTECIVAGGHVWDVWDNVNAKWVNTGIACNPLSNSWNHLTVQVQRTSGNQLLYQSITLNGVTHNLNWYFNPGSAPGWWGITVNYQMDGNHAQQAYSVNLDNLNFTYY